MIPKIAEENRNQGRRRSHPKRCHSHGRVDTRSRGLTEHLALGTQEMSSKRTVVAPQACQRERSFHVYLPRWSFCLCWWLVLVFHTILGGFAVCVAMLNRYLQQVGVSSFFSSFPFDIMNVAAFSFLFVACGHLFVITRMMWRSVKARHLTFHCSLVVPPRADLAQLAPPPKTCSVVLLLVYRLYDAAATAWRKYFSVNGFFALNGKHFEVAFTIREGIEIASQTYQAYNLSLSIPRVWINQLAVGAIVLNCFATPVVHVVLHRNVGVQRLLNLVQDSVLDFTCSVVIPVAIAMPYVLVFNTATYNFPPELMKDDVWYVNAKSETHHVIVTSFVDFVSTMMPQLSLLGCLMTLKNVIRRQPTRVGRVTTLSPTVVDLQRGVEVEAGETTHLGTIAERDSSPSNELLLLPMAARIRRRNKFVHGIFMLWGLGVLGLHLQASRTISNRVHGCQLYVGAWYSSGLACSVMNLNCHRQQIQGSTNEITSVLNQLDKTTLQLLVYLHCPALHIPPVATEFSRLVSLEFFNCSLVEWPEDAALRHANQPKVKYLYMILTNWTTFPVGILHNEMPLGMKHFLLVGNNMTELPATIGDLWSEHEWGFVAIDRSPALRELPASFCKLNALLISLASTGIHTLPSNCFNQTAALVISGSPVRELTASMAGSLVYIEAEHTPLTGLPAYLDAYVREQPSADAAKLYGSPMCDADAPHSFNISTYGSAYCGMDYHTTEGSYGWGFLPHRQFEQ